MFINVIIILHENFWAVRSANLSDFLLCECGVFITSGYFSDTKTFTTVSSANVSDFLLSVRCVY